MTPEWQTNTGKISKPCILLIGVLGYYMYILVNLLCNLLHKNAASSSIYVDSFS